jgi:hypothetical protein
MEIKLNHKLEHLRSTVVRINRIVRLWLSLTWRIGTSLAMELGHSSLSACGRNYPSPSHDVALHLAGSASQLAHSSLYQHRRLTLFDPLLTTIILFYRCAYILARFPKRALPTALPLGLPISPVIQPPISASASTSTPVSIPKLSMKYTISSVATFPVAPGL